MKLFFEKILNEGTDYKGKAVKKIVDSGLFDKDVSEKIITALQKEDIHAFNHAPAWTEKYLIGIANMLIKYCNGDSSKAQEFLTECINVFESYITWVKENRPKMDTKQQAELDKKFNEQMSFEDVIKANEEHYNELDAKSKEEISKMDFSASSNFELIPIDSYEQFHKMFGGHWTGDGSSDDYAGGGGTAWCHTNNEPTYNQYVDKGKYQFFILANKDWKNIPFNKESNRENPKDDYGNSLIALVINKRTGSLKYATLRCNHVGVSTNADNQYKTYAELSAVAGFNVEDKVKDYLKDTIIDNSSIDSVWKSFDGTSASLEAICDALGVDNETLTHIEIPYGVEALGDDVFYHCDLLDSINIPDSVETIGAGAFFRCAGLSSIHIPESVKQIGDAAFAGCFSLANITLPSGIKKISDDMFMRCTLLDSISIPDGVESIGESAFRSCANLHHIDIPKSVYFIGFGAFRRCKSLVDIVIPDGVTHIDSYTFSDCDSLTNVTLPMSIVGIEPTAFENSPNVVIKTNNSYVIDYCKENNINYESTSNESLTNTFKFKLLEKVLKEDIASVRKNYPKIEDETFDALIRLDPTFKENKNSVGTYGKWILNLYNKGNLKEEDFYKVTDYLTEFEENKKNFKNKDIGQFKTLPDLSRALRDVVPAELSHRQQVRQNQKARKNADLGNEASLVYEDGEWEVWIPHTYAASCKLGENSSWCTASTESDHYYNHYKSYYGGEYYINISKSNENDKYQFHFESSQFMDIDDDSINLGDFLSKNTGLKEFYKPIIFKLLGKDLDIEETDKDYYSVTFEPNDSTIRDCADAALESYCSSILYDMLGGNSVDLWDAYDWGYLDSSYLSQHITNSFYEYLVGFEQIRKVLENNDVYSFEDFEELVDENSDVEDALLSALRDANIVGAENECEKQYNDALNECGIYPVMGAYYYGSRFAFSYDELLDIMSETDETEFNIVNLITAQFSEHKYDFEEPRYGWNGFDEDDFYRMALDNLFDVLE